MAIGNMRRSVFTDSNLETFQQAIIDQFQQIANVDIVNGRLISGITIVAGTPTNVQHKLGRVPKGYFLAAKNSNSSIWNGTFTSTVIPLNASANSVVSIWVF